MANQQNNTNPNWLIMVYIAADDMLSDFAVGSLQQLKLAAGQDSKVVVAAQFDANGKQNIPRLIFKGVDSRKGSIDAYRKDEISSNTNMADPLTLTDFINWAYAQQKANHYCLVLWGHGPELLVGDYPLLPNGRKPKRFLTPADLRKALAETNTVRDGHKFEIVAIDACNMSMVELACEISDYAEFLVASQEEVPDFSFPYDKLLILDNAGDRHEIAKVCQEMPRRYIDAYQDYIRTKATQTESITLSSLSLNNTASIIDLISRLTDSFLKATPHEKKRQAIIDARANSKDFVAGLYVDLYDFCQQLRSELGLKNIADQNLLSICERICDAIRSRDENAIVIANEVSQERRCHGFSIYFPYVSALEQGATDKGAVRNGTNFSPENGRYAGERSGTETLAQRGVEFTNPGRTDSRNQSGWKTQSRGGMDLLSKGGMDLLSKGGMDLLSKGGMDLLSKMRRQRIEETELYYDGLKLPEKTRWNQFIRHGWSRWLAEEAASIVKSSPETDMSDILNQQYSAQQCAFNLLSLCRKLEEGRRMTTSLAAEDREGYDAQGKPVPASGVTTR